MEKIIAVVGLCGSGKSVAADFFEKQGYIKIHFGQITMDEVKKRNLPVNETNERIVREELRSEHGMGAYAVKSLPKIDELLSRGDKILIDGLYSFSEYKILIGKYPKQLVVLAIFTDKDLRYKRLSTREYRPLSYKEAELRDFAEIENIEKGGPIAIADYTIINNFDKYELEKKLISFLKTITQNLN